jgi:hypothetical protein
MDTTSLPTKKERGESGLKQEGDFSGCVMVEWSPHQPGMAEVCSATRCVVEEFVLYTVVYQIVFIMSSFLISGCLFQLLYEVVTVAPLTPS